MAMELSGYGNVTVASPDVFAYAARARSGSSVSYTDEQACHPGRRAVAGRRISARSRRTGAESGSSPRTLTRAFHRIDGSSLASSVSTTDRAIS
jgi:hypothetical protein